MAKDTHFRLQTRKGGASVDVSAADRTVQPHRLLACCNNVMKLSRPPSRKSITNTYSRILPHYVVLRQMSERLTRRYNARVEAAS